MWILVVCPAIERTTAVLLRAPREALESTSFVKQFDYLLGGFALSLGTPVPPLFEMKRNCVLAALITE